MESKLVYVIDAFLANLDDNDDVRNALEELAEDPCEWVCYNLDNEIHDMDSKLGTAIWNFGFQNIDFEYIQNIYIIKLKEHDENANKRANDDANESEEE